VAQQFVSASRPCIVRRVFDSDKAITLINQSAKDIYVSSDPQQLMNQTPGGTPTQGIKIAAGTGLQWPNLSAGEIWARADTTDVFLEVQP